MNIRRYRYSKGFTLIELLVVIAIIGMLSSVVLSSLQTARARARDTERITEIGQVTTALELAYEKNKRFPCHALQTDQDDTFLKPFVDAGYIARAPIDPSGGTYKYEYATMGDPGSCGNYAFLGVYYENSPVRCPSLGFVALDGNNHCHIWYPQLPPCPAFNINGGPSSNGDPTSPCAAYGDSSAENEY